MLSGCYKEAVQFGVFFCYVTVSCLTVFDEIYGTTMNFVFFVRVTLIKTVNTPVDVSAVLVLSVINGTIADALAFAISCQKFGRITKKWRDSGFAGAGAKMQ